MIRRYLLPLFLPLLLMSPLRAETVDATLSTTAKTTQYRAKEENGTVLGVYSSAQAAGDASCAASNASAVMGGDPWVYTGPAMRSGCGAAPSAGNYVAAMAKRTSDNATLCVGCGKSAGNVYSLDTVLACPSGYSLNSSTGLCEKYTCPAGYEGPTASGGKWVCSTANPCEAKAGQSSYGWITIQIGGPSPYGSKCAGGCSQYVTGPVSGPDNPNGDYYTNGKTRTEYAKWQFDGSSCSAGDAAPTPSTQPPRTPPKEPPCAAGEGVMTSSSGKLNCVPPGTPESTPPVVKKETEKKTNPDNTTAETTTTTTRDPSTGVEQKSSSTTTCSGTNCTTSTSTSTSGSGTNGNGTPDGTGNSDFCQKNPTLDICTGKIAKEETLGKIKDSLDPKEAADKSKLDAAKQDFDDKQKAHKDFIDAFAAKAQSDEGGLLKWAMIPEVPAGSCAPFTGTVMGRVVTFDFCDSLAKVRDIAGYGFYLMTMFALFAIFASSTTSGGKS